MKKIKKKGFTLLETIITMAILIMVIGIAFPFFNSNFKTLNETEIRNDLQRDGNNAMEYFTKAAMQANKVKVINDVNNNDKLTSSEATKIGEITFITDTDEEFTFNLQNRIVKYSTSTSKVSGINIAENVTAIEVNTVDKRIFNECKGVNIKITLSKNEVKSYIIESQIYFRNLKNSN